MKETSYRAQNSGRGFINADSCCEFFTQIQFTANLKLFTAQNITLLDEEDAQRTKKEP